MTTGERKPQVVVSDAGDVTSCCVSDAAAGVVLLPVVSAGRRCGAGCRRGDLPARSAETAELQTLLWIPERG